MHRCVKNAVHLHRCFLHVCALIRSTFLFWTTTASTTTTATATMTKGTAALIGPNGHVVVAVIHACLRNAGANIAAFAQQQQ